MIFMLFNHLSNRKKLFVDVYKFIHLNVAIALFLAYLVFAGGGKLGAKNPVRMIIIMTMCICILYFV